MPWAKGIIKQVGCWPSSTPAKFRPLEVGVTLWKSCRHVDVYTISSPMHAHKHMGEREEACARTGLHTFTEAQEDPRKRDG